MAILWRKNKKKRCVFALRHTFFVSMQPFSKALPDATRTFRKLRRDVSGCTSGHNDYYVGTYQMLRRDIISSMSSVKLQKKQMKKPSIEPKKRIFAQCSLSFHPKIPLKHLYFAGFVSVSAFIPCIIQKKQ